MKKIAENDSDMSSRRNFLKKVGAGVGAISISGIAGAAVMKSSENEKSGKMVKLLSPDGKLVEVDQDDIKPAKEITGRGKGGCKGRVA